MIVGELVVLRPVEAQDLENWVVWFNDLETTQYLNRIYPYGRADAETYWKSSQQNSNELLYSIVLKRNNSHHIGSIGLRHIDWRSRNAELSIMLGPKEYWGHGYGRDAVLSLCKFAFQEMGLQRVFLYVRSDHEGAIKAYQKAGFQVEGVARKQLYRNGSYWDLTLMGVLAGELL